MHLYYKLFMVAIYKHVLLTYRLRDLELARGLANSSQPVSASGLNRAGGGSAIASSCFLSSSTRCLCSSASFAAFCSVSASCSDSHKSELIVTQHHNLLNILSTCCPLPAGRSSRQDLIDAFAPFFRRYCANFT